MVGHGAQCVSRSVRTAWELPTKHSILCRRVMCSRAGLDKQCPAHAAGVVSCVCAAGACLGLLLQALQGRNEGTVNVAADHRPR